MISEIQKIKDSFSEATKIKKPLILDGATGSLLQQIGYKPDSAAWMTFLNKSSPEIISAVHRSYIEAGADIITTNTFRTNPAALLNAGIYDVAPLVKEAVDIAKQAVDGLPVYIAGSNAPAEDCYQINRKLSYNELELNHKKHIDLLIENKVHFILNETQSHFDEIEIICNHCHINKIPYILSLLFDNKLKIFSGESIKYVLEFILEHDPLAIGFNCIAPGLFERLLDIIELNFRWGFYLNCAGEIYSKDKIESVVDSFQYSMIIENSLKFKPSFVGACCGSTPEHIKAIRKLLNGKID